MKRSLPNNFVLFYRLKTSQDATTKMLGNASLSILTDLSPADNNLEIDLQSLNK